MVNLKNSCKSINYKQYCNLQSKNSIGIDDYVQAEYTINSVLKGYKVTDDGVLDEANEVMAVITAYKDKEKDLGPDVDNIIEIGDGND